MLGDLYGYWSGSSTWIFHSPPVKGAVAGAWASETVGRMVRRTLWRAKEPHMELLHVVVYKRDLIVRHESAPREAGGQRRVPRHATQGATHSFMTSVSMRRLDGELCTRKGQPARVATTARQVTHHIRSREVG